MNEHLFEFTMKAAEADTLGCYSTNWETAENISVFAKNRNHAYDLASDALSDPRGGRKWVFRVENIRHVFPKEDV